MSEQDKQEVVLTPVPRGKKISEMTDEELLHLIRGMREAARPAESEDGEGES